MTNLDTEGEDVTPLRGFQPESYLVRESREERIYWSIGGLFSKPLVRYALETDHPVGSTNFGLSCEEVGDETVWTVNHDGRFLNMVARTHGVWHLATWSEASVVGASCITNLDALRAWLHQFWDLVEARYALRGDLR